MGKKRFIPAQHFGSTGGNFCAIKRFRNAERCVRKRVVIPPHAADKSDLADGERVRLQPPPTQLSHAARELFAEDRFTIRAIRPEFVIASDEMRPLVDHLAEQIRARGHQAIVLPVRVWGVASTEAAERVDSYGRVVEAIACLPPRQQEIVRLKFQHGMSYKQIADVMKLTPTNVGFILHTAIKTLRDQFAVGGTE